MYFNNKLLANCDQRTAAISEDGLINAIKELVGSIFCSLNGRGTNCTTAHSDGVCQASPTHLELTDDIQWGLTVSLGGVPADRLLSQHGVRTQ